MREELNEDIGDDELGDEPAGPEVTYLGGDEPLRDRAELLLRSIYDPEIPVNIYDLGLIYGVQFLESDDNPAGKVKVMMTLTSPGCPAAIILPGEVEEKMNELTGGEGAEVEVVWDPPWTPDRMSEAAKLELGMF